MALRGIAPCISACCRRTQKDSSLLLFPFYNTNNFKSLSPNSYLPIHQLPRHKIRIRALSEAIVNPVTPNEKNDKPFSSPENWKIKMLYDGDCPLCMREVNMLRERNTNYGTIKFVDISSEDYSPDDNQGLDFETAMGRIHAILSDGTIVTDVEAFRRLYEQVGLGWVYAITKYEPIGKLADVVYDVWAKYRLPITGRPPIEEIMEARRKKKDEVCNDKNSCKM